MNRDEYIEALKIGKMECSNCGENTDGAYGCVVKNKTLKTGETVSEKFPVCCGTCEDMMMEKLFGIKKEGI